RVLPDLLERAVDVHLRQVGDLELLPPPRLRLIAPVLTPDLEVNEPSAALACVRLSHGSLFPTRSSWTARRRACPWPPRSPLAAPALCRLGAARLREAGAAGGGDGPAGGVVELADELHAALLFVLGERGAQPVGVVALVELGFVMRPARLVTVARAGGDHPG